jgi:hypothetical protein
MSDFTILMYEDDEEYKNSFEYNVAPRANAKGRTLKVVHKTNGDTVEQDLFMCIPNLIMIDHDLVVTTGDTIIAMIDQMPECRTISLYYYSGGETMSDLERRAQAHLCNIRCFTKTDGELEQAVLEMM